MMRALCSAALARADRREFEILGALLGPLRQRRSVAIESRADRRAVIFDRGAERGEARVEVLRALLGRLRQRSFVTIERRADRRAVMIEGGAEPVAMSVEQGADALRVLAHLVFELRTAGFEPLAHLLQRRDDLVLEPLHADAEGARDVFHAARQSCVDVLRQRRDGLRQFPGPLLQGLADLRRLGVHALHDLATAFAERAGDFERVARQRLRQGPAALREAFLDAGEQAVERARHLVEPGFRPLVDPLQVGIEQGGRLLVAAPETSRRPRRPD